jgi:hypothetical protein
MKLRYADLLIIAAFALAIAVSVAVSRAHAQQTTTQVESFVDSAGHFAGSSATHGNETAYSNARGGYAGSAIRNSDGTTTLYDSRGHYSGSVYRSGPRGGARSR